MADSKEDVKDDNTLNIKVVGQDGNEVSSDLHPCAAFLVQHPVPRSSTLMLCLADLLPLQEDDALAKADERLLPAEWPCAERRAIPL